MSGDCRSYSGADESVNAASTALNAFLERLIDLGRPGTLESLAATDITFSQLRILSALACQPGPMSVNAIADQVQLSLAAAGRTVDKLVGCDLVDRREDPSDRRVKRISLTDAGRRYLETHLAVKRGTIRHFVANLPTDMRDNLCAALRPIVDDAVDHFCLPSDGRQAS
ncbi:MarR family winged helix-turn-helix transcriptional regulator [Gordonia terrae]|uniref:MarR family transcriptional regulator n=1 Tax=Gordonia terrae TaxID=2055 RepID=A0AAD0K4C7_9ACTN|nr:MULTISPECIES: MarR family transcriptional regulator [Gordonia]ANY22108.1 MarR family transcriptional regulator [Gordonia terrae]AWO82848.1 MarR family transcriptional regulator [Gordonia terrae]VTR09475.1 transcriptional regulator, MarR family [Clostridioides difficile]